MRARLSIGASPPLVERQQTQARQAHACSSLVGCRTLHHRDPGPIAALLDAAARGEAVAELIGDRAYLSDQTAWMTLEIIAPIGS